MVIFERNCVQRSIDYQTVKITELLAQQTTAIHQPLSTAFSTINKQDPVSTHNTGDAWVLIRIHRPTILWGNSSHPYHEGATLNRLMGSRTPPPPTAKLLPCRRGSNNKIRNEEYITLLSFMPRGQPSGKIRTGCCKEQLLKCGF